MPTHRANGNKFEILNQRPISAWKWPKIAVFVPMLPAWPFADEVWPYFNEIARTGVDFVYHPFGTIDSVRNRVCEALLMSDWTHILMLDADQKHQIDIVQMMARHVIDDPERLIIGGLYYNRREPFLPLAWIEQDGELYQIHKWEKGLIEGLALIAGGCMLINKKVFEMIERPWFYNDYEGLQEKKGDFVYPTEDIGFCRKARKAGITIYLDTTINSPHARSGWVDEQTYRTYCEMHPEDPELFKELAYEKI